MSKHNRTGADSNSTINHSEIKNCVRSLMECHG